VDAALPRHCRCLWKSFSADTPRRSWRPRPSSGTASRCCTSIRRC
jgi:hypothetical protein